MRKRTAMKHASSISRPTLFLFLVIISIPLVSLYAGFAIGSYFAPNPSRLSDSEVVVSAAKLNFSWYNTHNITVNFDGGLGNYLFQYASLYGIGRASGMKPIVPKAFKLYNIFPNLKAKSEDIQSGGKQPAYSKFLEIKPGVFDSRTFMLNFMKNIKLYGFFQSWRYFDFTRNDVRRQFQFKSSIEEDVNKFLAAQMDDFKKRHSNRDFSQASSEKAIQFIGIHVRRGDYLDEKSIEKGYSTPDIYYYNNAMKYFAKKYENIIFVVCSDDIKWSKENIGSIENNAVFSPFASKGAELDLCLLSKCNHTIISVGTFGWWGAWLSGGTTVYYSKFARPDSPLSRTFNPGDYFVPQWIPM